MAAFFAFAVVAAVLGPVSQQHLCAADQSSGVGGQSLQRSGSGGGGGGGSPTQGQKHNGLLMQSNGNGGVPSPLQPSSSPLQPSSGHKTPCVCGVFLSSQIPKGAGKQPTGYAALLHEQDEPAACNALGVKTCTNKCLEIIAKHLPNSPAIICGSVDRDVYKERAHLFVKNCKDSWINTLLSTGKEYCCKDSVYNKCPL